MQGRNEPLQSCYIFVLVLLSTGEVRHNAISNGLGNTRVIGFPFAEHEVIEPNWNEILFASVSCFALQGFGEFVQNSGTR